MTTNYPQYDNVWWMLYDKVAIKKGQVLPRIRLMTGVISKEKGLEATNLYYPHSLPPPCHFTIKGFSVFRPPTTDKKTYDYFMGNVGLQLWVGQKTFFDAPGAMFCSEYAMKDFITLVNDGILKDRFTGEEKHGVVIPICGAVEFPKDFELSVHYGLDFSLDLMYRGLDSIGKSIEVFGVIWGINHRSVQ